MASREFGQYCGLARALELVGERWTLLIVRELLARPVRYTDLIEELPGIPTNLLSTRLKELEEAGIVERQVAPAPQRGVVYTLSDDGRRLEAAVLTLAMWGNAHLAEHQPGDRVPASSLAMALRAMFHRDAASTVNASWEIHASHAILYAVVHDGELTSGVGPAPEAPDLVIAMRSDAVPTYQELMQAIGSRDVELDGRKSLLPTFARLFAPRQ